MSTFSHRGHVYFAACGKYVKIGYTAGAVHKRIAGLPGKVLVPADFDRADTIWLLHKIPGCIMRDERRLHGLFAAHRVEGEWFYMSPAFLDQLARMQYVTYLQERLNFRRARAAVRRSLVSVYAEAEAAA